MGCAQPRDIQALARSASTCGSRGDPITDCLPAFRKVNSAESRPWRAAPVDDQRRSESPSGGSTLTTSAPASTSSFEQ
jgi:hypothetical protein